MAKSEDFIALSLHIPRCLGVGPTSTVLQLYEDYLRPQEAMHRRAGTNRRVRWSRGADKLGSRQGT